MLNEPPAQQHNIEAASISRSLYKRNFTHMWDGCHGRLVGLLIRIFLYRSTLHLLPPYLCESIKPRAAGQYFLHSQELLTVPRVHTARGEVAVQYSAPKPGKTHKTSDLNTFKL